MSAQRFELHEIDRGEGVVFRRFDSDRVESIDVVVPVRLWMQWDRPVSITVEIVPGLVFADGGVSS